MRTFSSPLRPRFKWPALAVAAALVIVAVRRPVRDAGIRADRVTCAGHRPTGACA